MLDYQLFYTLFYYFLSRTGVNMEDMADGHFNSIKVRLIPSFSPSTSTCSVYFNSIKVRLILVLLLGMLLSIKYFNSIKVRLIRGTNIARLMLPVFQFHKGSIDTQLERAGRAALPAFQFHKGSIDTLQQKILSLLFPIFQFHKGSIDTPEGNAQTMLVTYFNSIKVRLILGGIIGGPVGAGIFQFHKGSIDTVAMRMSMAMRMSNFNSIKVRLILRKTRADKVKEQNFNSIKVRLIPSFHTMRVLKTPVFQFHKGSIDTKIPFFLI